MDLREAAMRQHRSIALFSLIQCWIRDLDGLEIARSDLQRLLDLERLKDTRIHWLESDFKEFFARASYDTNSEMLSVSGRPSETDGSQRQSGSKQPQVKPSARKKERIGAFQIWANPSERHLISEFAGLSPFFEKSANFHERLLSAYLLLLAQGQLPPQSLFGTENG